MDELRPRQYAGKILALATLEERRRYLAEEVPDHFRDLVREHVVNAVKLGRWGK